MRPKHISAASACNRRTCQNCSSLRLCSDNLSKNQAKKLRCLTIKCSTIPETILSDTLVNTYSKIGNLKYARHAFDHIPQRDICSRNASSFLLM
ncbi:hypothetical protein NL676_032205 [Syzygium grande]|nr:hypothetical protein NL676_032205 [Syzygium grande]